MKRLSISTTDRSTFKRCRQQWEFTSSLKLYQEPLRPQEPLWFGTMMHEALAAYYDPQFPERDVDRALLVYGTACQASYKEYEQLNGTIWQEERQAFEELEKLGVDMITRYCTEFAPTVDDFEVIFVEEIYTIELGHYCDIHGWATVYDDGSYQGCCDNQLPVVYIFKVDALVKDAKGQYWILENKSAKQWSENRRWLSMDEQPGSYIWCVEQKYGIKVAGVLYNTLIKREHRPLKMNQNGKFSVDKRQSVSFVDAVHAIEASGQQTDEYQEFLDYLQMRDELENPWFRREKIRRNPNETKLQGAIIIEEAKMMIDPGVVITRTPNQFNCGSCAFYDPCIAKWEGGDWQFLLDNLYRRKAHRGDSGNTN